MDSRPRATKAAAMALAGALAFLAWLAVRAPPGGGRPGSHANPAEIGPLVASLPARSDRLERVLVPATRADSTAAAAAAPRGGVLHIRVTWAEDGQPAAGVPVRIVPVGVADSRLHEREMLTDATGEVLVGGLPPGVYAPEACLGGRTEARVDAGSVAHASIAIPGGVAVRGQVVDEEGGPVAGAEIWLSYGTFRLIGAVVTSSSADGTFALRAVHCTPLRYLGARGAGYAPSPSAILAGEPGTTVDVRLELARASGEVFGHVAARTGEPQENALVVLGSDSSAETRYADGTRAIAPPPIRVRTDGHGNFRVRCAPSGRTPILVRAPGFGPWRREVEVPQSGSIEVDVQLDPGVTVFGTVRGSDRQPVAGVEVRIGDWDDPAGSFVRTGADGCYRLDAVGSGDFEVSATSAVAGRASAWLFGRTGSLVRWDPVLLPGATLTFRIVDERDAPLSGWTVEVGASIEGSWDSRWGDTGADGRFLAVNWPSVASVLRVTEPGAKFATVQIEDMRPGPGETVVRVLDAQRATGRVIGTLVLPDGAPLAGSRVTVSRSRDPVIRTLISESSTGRFLLECMPPGEYAIHVRHPGFPQVALGPHELGAGETWDVGAVQLAVPGRLVVSFQRADGAPVGKPRLHCRKNDSTVYDEPEVDGYGLARSAPLAAGKYRLFVFGKDIVSVTYGFEIAAGKDTDLSVVLRTGVQVRLVLRDSPSCRIQANAMHLRIFDRDGVVMSEVDLTRQRSGCFEWTVGLPGGSYQLEAKTADGVVHAAAGFSLAATALPGMQFDFQLQ